MSKLVEKLKSLNREAAPMGFRPAEARSQRPPLLIIGRLPALPADSSNSPTGAMTGLDAAFIPGKGLTTEALKQSGKAVLGLPFGFSAEGVDPAGFTGLAEVGADFIVFGLKAAAPVLELEKLGKFLELPVDTEAADVMTASELAAMVDGVVISSGADTAITLEYLLACRRAVQLFGVPVLAEVPASVTTAELKWLWEAGVDGIVIGDTEAITSIKKVVESLPVRGRRQWGSKPRPVLPRLSESVPSEEEEDASFRASSFLPFRANVRNLAGWGQHQPPQIPQSLRSFGMTS
ncbi:MAG: hypothetical protein AB1597_01025 [Chloroflexota bacterium]